MEINDIIIFLCGFLAGGGVVGLFFTINSMRRRLNELERSGPKKLPYKSRDEIENAIAAINYLYFDRQLENDAIENALAHLRKARNPD